MHNPSAWIFCGFYDTQVKLHSPWSCTDKMFVYVIGHFCLSLWQNFFFKWKCQTCTGSLGFCWFCRQAAVWLASQKNYPGIPNSPTSLEIWNISAMAQKTALSCASCLVFWLFGFFGFFGFVGFCFVLTSPNVIHQRKTFDYSHCFQQNQHLLCPGGKTAENNQIRDLSPSGSAFHKWLPSSIPHTQNLSQRT